MRSLKNTLRALRNQTTATVQQIERELGGELDALMPQFAGRVGRRAYETGNAGLGVLSVGQSVAFADRVEPLAAIDRRLEDEAQRALGRLARVCGSRSR